MGAPRFAVKRPDADEYLTFDLGSNAIYYAPPACAYSFGRAQADLLAERHGGIVGTLETVWGPGMRVLRRTWTPATIPAKILPFPRHASE